MRRITLADIAKEAGVSKMTVSNALRNTGRVSPGMRKKVRSIADRLGYVPDPALSALNVYRRGREGGRRRFNLAYVTGFATRSGWRQLLYYEDYFRGAVERADELGYRLREYWLGEGGFSARRNGDILESRGVLGVILSPYQFPQDHPDLDLSRFAAVALGRSLLQPHVHRASNDQFLSMIMLLDRLRERGYRRIGLYLHRTAHEKTQFRWSAAYREWCGNARDGVVSLPPLLRNRQPVKALTSWVREHRPDIVISSNDVAIRQLRKAGWRVPKDIAYADLAVRRPDSATSGIYQRPVATGKAAMDLLHLLLQRNDRGPPAVPETISLEGQWIEGETAPRRD